MIIAMDLKYNKLADQLEKLGYKTVDYNSKTKVEAVLYHSGEAGSFTNIQSSSQLINGENGILLIDIKDKDVNMIDEILRRRLYTPLF